jgi:hypothetical protein
MSGAGMAALMAPVGPVAERFVNDPRFLTAIMGPYGSAKTTSCIRKIFNSTLLQHPQRDGVRRARWCVVRDTYQQLETNVLNSWFTWFPKTKDNWHGGQNLHRIRYEIQQMDGSEPFVVELEMYFRAMGDQKAEQVLKGLELTGLWLNEVDTLDKSVLRFGLPRVGRYPSAKDGGCAWSGVIADFNAPDIDNWTYDLYVDQNLPIEAETLEALREALGSRFGIGFHRQPGGRSVDPLPENIRNLPDGYYQTMMLGLSQADIRRFIDNEFGAVRNGQPVYPEYNDDFHCAKDVLKPLPDVPVCAGLDGGTTPALVWGQRGPSGQIRTLDEVVVYAPDQEQALERLGPKAHGRLCRQQWDEKFGRCTLGDIWGDPAIFYGQSDGYDWIKAWEDGFNEPPYQGAPRLRAKVKSAPKTQGNRLTPRIECVRAGLVTNAGAQPGQLISPVCRVLRRGFNNGYVINRVKLSNGTGKWKDEPVKNDFSHVHDAKQYLDLGLTHRGDTLLAMARGSMARVKAKPKFGTGFFAHRG